MNESQKQLNLQRSRIFLSYAKEDEIKVKSFYKKLLRERLNPWIDLTDLSPGQDWDSVIVKAIRNARFVIVFLSNYSVNKRGYVQKEIAEALDLADRMPEDELFIIPVRLEECTVPSRLSKWQWIDVFRQGGFKRVVNAIKINLGIDDSALISQHDQHHRKALSKDAISDLLFIDLIPFGGAFFHTHLPTGKVVISNSHFMEFRDTMPKAFRHLKREFPPYREFNSKHVDIVISNAGSYQKDTKLLKEIKPVNNEKSSYILVSKGNNRCAIYKKYMQYIQIKYPDAKVYLTNPTTPIVVEDDGELRFIVMPFAVESTVLSAA